MNKTVIELANNTSVEVNTNPELQYTRIWFFPNEESAAEWRQKLSIPMVNIRETKRYVDWFEANKENDLFFSVFAFDSGRELIRELRTLGAEVIWYCIEDYTTPPQLPLQITGYDTYLKTRAEILELEADYLVYAFPTYLLVRKDLRNAPHRIWLRETVNNKMRIVGESSDSSYATLSDLTLGYTYTKVKGTNPVLSTKYPDWLETYGRYNGFGFDIVIPYAIKTLDDDLSILHTETVESNIKGKTNITYELLLGEQFTKTTENVESYLDGGV